MNAGRLVGLTAALVALVGAADETTDLLMPGIVPQVRHRQRLLPSVVGRSLGDS